MKRLVMSTAVLVLLGAFAHAAYANDASALEGAKLDNDPAVVGSSANYALGLLKRTYTAKQISEGVYVGSQFCLACHPSYRTWRDTLHASFLRRPLPRLSLQPRRGVIADYDANGVDDFIQGLDFNAIDSAFDAYKPNAPVLSVQAGIYYVRIGALRCPVTFTLGGQGGGSGQRYVVRIPVGDTDTGFTESNYFAPLQFQPGAGWLPNAPQNWYDEAGNPRWGAGVTEAQLAGNHGGNYSQTCVGCHATGIRNIGPNEHGETVFNGFVAVLFEPNSPRIFDYDGDGNFELMNIGCESCHGPGSAHVSTSGNPRFIVNPKDLPVPAQVDICGRCHSEPHSVPNATYNWPYDDATGTDWTPFDAEDGVPLSDYFTDASVRWPDGKHGKITRPYHDFLESPKPTFPFAPVACSDCHDPHQEAQPHLIRTSVVEDGVRIATEVDNNTLCLSCHASHGPFADLTPEEIAGIDEPENHDQVARVVSAHTHHPYGPERNMGLSRCVTCHMPLTAGFSTLTLPSHTFEAIGPFKTLDFQDQGGMPNSCAQSCHGRLVNSFALGLDANLNNSVWNEQFDRDLAEDLLNYYGPGGLWWDTDEDEP